MIPKRAVESLEDETKEAKRRKVNPTSGTSLSMSDLPSYIRNQQEKSNSRRYLLTRSESIREQVRKRERLD